MTFRLKYLLVYIIFTVASIYPIVTFAEAWELRPTITLGQKYDDNFYMESTPHSAVTESTLNGVLEFSRITETSNAVGRAYANFSNVLSSDQFFTFTLQKNNELTNFGLDGYFRRDTTTSAIDQITVNSAKNTQSDKNVNEQYITDADQGLVQVRLKRNTIQLSPNINRQLTERFGAGASYSFDNVFYDSNQNGTGVYDYNQHGVNGWLYWSLTELDSLSTGLSLSQYNSNDADNTVVIGSQLTASYNRSVSELTSGRIEVGVNSSTLKSNSKNSGQSGYVFRLKMSHRSQLTRYGAELSHDLQPSGYGSLVQSSQGRAIISRQIREKLSADLNLRVNRIEPIYSEGLGKRYFLVAESRLNWYLALRWSLSGGYRYQRREEINSVDDAESNSIFVSIVYSEKFAVE